VLAFLGYLGGGGCSQPVKQIVDREPTLRKASVAVAVGSSGARRRRGIVRRARRGDGTDGMPAVTMLQQLNTLLVKLLDLVYLKR